MSRNLIYTCVFSNDNYVKLTIELIKSFLKSNPEENGCDFLVYTNQSYRDLILAEISDTRIKFHINNYYNTMNQSRISKIDIFDYKELHNYEKILYLDTDSLITGDVNQMFSEFQNEKTETMFVLKEGNVLAENELWGRTLFMKNAKTEDRPGIQACVFGFINRDSGNIKKMFLKIKQQFFLDMYQGKLLFYDQPYLNYNFYESGLCKLDTETLGKYCNGGARTYNSQYIIHHFSGCPGNYDVKSELINDFKIKSEFVNDFKNKIQNVRTVTPMSNNESISISTYITDMVKWFIDKFVENANNMKCEQNTLTVKDYLTLFTKTLQDGHIKFKETLETQEKKRKEFEDMLNACVEKAMKTKNV